MVSEVKEFYSNDIVYRFDKRKRISFGTVVDSYEASTDADDGSALQKGQLRIWWLNSSREQVWRQNKVRLMSRTVIPGDVVRRLEHGRETQRGYCKESKQFATVQIVGTDKIVERVPSERLQYISVCDTNTAVCLGAKYGRVQSVDEVITMQSKDGSKVSVLTGINHDIEDYWLTKHDRGPFDAFYPGQEVTCTPANLELATWIHRSKPLKKNMQARRRFTIQSVEQAEMEVLWIDFNENGGGYKTHVEDLKTEDIKKLKVLQPVEAQYLELAERKLLKLNSSDVLMKRRDWLRKQSALHRKSVQKSAHVIRRNNKSVSKFRGSSLLTTCVDGADTEGDDSWTSADGEGECDADGNPESGSSSSSVAIPRQKKHFPPKARDIVPGCTVPVEVLCVDSKATVVWQDGVEEKDIPTTQLYYSVSLDDHEFFPGEWVVAESEKEDNSHYGAIQLVNYLERTATVKWFTYLESEQKPQELGTAEVSVYDLRKHQKFAFRPGSIVKNKPTVENKMGYVLDSYPQGYVKVHWIDGTEEDCWPQNIELIPDGSEYSFSMDDEEDGGQVSWETESVESVAGDITDETMLQNMAARLDFVRSRIIYLKEAFKEHSITENFAFLRDLLIVYDNSSYLDKLLETSFFSLKSKHFQMLLAQVKERAKQLGLELKGRLFVHENLCPSSTKHKVAEKENIFKVIKLENKINAQIESTKDAQKEINDLPSPLTPETSIELECTTNHDNLCIELLTMLKVRMDLAYAEIISRIGGTQALSVMTKASEISATPSSSTPIPPVVPTSPEDESFTNVCPLNVLKSVINCESESYSIIDEAHISHHFFASAFEPVSPGAFYKAVQKEYKSLQESLPPGVWVRSYGNRLDLLSVMIRGPSKTPYEDGLFLFDVQLSPDYPRSPPYVQYISYSSERLNPNLYVDGKVCISLLGTWLGRGSEVWGSNSTLLQLIVSIQGLILVAEPYYNEAGYEKQCDSQQGIENSRTYNEFVILKLVQSMTQMLKNPPHVFKQEVLAHFAVNGGKMCERLMKYCSETDPLQPEFPLLPVSKGLKLSLDGAIRGFQEMLKRIVEERVDANAKQ